MGSSVAGLIQEGIAAFKAGRKDEAQHLLSRATELDEHNEEAWLWLSAMVDSLENQQICLENVLAINPHNTRALKGLEMIQRQLSKKAQSPQVPPSITPTPPAAPASVDPFEVPPTPSPASPASPPAATEEKGYHGSGRQVALPSEDEYDAWLQGLNLGGDEPTARAEPPAPPPPAADPFEFDSGPFQQSAEVEEAAFMANLDEPVQDEYSDAYADMVSPEPEPEEYAQPSSFDPFALPQSDVSSYGDTDVDDYADMGSSGSDPFADLDMADGDFASASPFATAEMDVVYETEDDLIENLNFIPDEIKATHLPGQGPRFPRLLLVGVGLVGLGALASVGTMIYLIVTRMG